VTTPEPASRRTQGVPAPAGEPGAAAKRPAPIAAIPVRHWGRWLAAAAILVAAAALLVSLAKNPNVDVRTIGEYLFKPLTLRGAVVTVELTIVAMVIGILGGMALAVMRLSDNPVLSWLAWVYIWLFRGTPLLVQILFWGFLGALYPTLFLGIPFTGIVWAEAPTSSLIGATTAAILALGLNEAAYAAEIIRAGIISVDRGQREAALSLGMTSGLTMRGIVLPQAMRVVVPPMGNETITMLKSTSLVAIISGHELMSNLQAAYAQNFKIIPLLIVASLWYLFLVTILSIGQYYLERYFGRGFGGRDVAGAERRMRRREARRV
jgi:polar amino acid transport system permease protein